MYIKIIKNNNIILNFLYRNNPWSIKTNDNTELIDLFLLYNQYIYVTPLNSGVERCTRSDVEGQRPLRDGTTLENKGTQSRMQSRMRPNLKCLTLEMPNSNYPQRPQRRKQRTEPQSHIQRRAARNVQGQRTANDNNSCRVVVVVPGGTGC